MRKNMIKIGVIGMALVFALGVSFNAIAMEPVAAVTSVPTKTAVTSNVISDKTSLTVEQKTAMKTTMSAFFKVEIQKLVDSNILTSELAAKLLNHEKGVKVVLTAAQKDAVRAAAIQAGKDTLTKLEQDGTITKAQADKLALIKMGHKGNGFGFGHDNNGQYNNGQYNNGHNKMMNNNGHHNNGHHNNGHNNNDHNNNDHNKMMNNNSFAHEGFNGMNSGN